MSSTWRHVSSSTCFSVFYLYIQVGICTYIHFPIVCMYHCCGKVPGNTHERPVKGKNHTITVKVEIQVEKNFPNSHFGKLEKKVTGINFRVFSLTSLTSTIFFFFQRKIIEIWIIILKWPFTQSNVTTAVPILCYILYESSPYLFTPAIYFLLVIRWAGRELNCVTLFFLM